MSVSLSFGVGSVHAWLLQEQMTGALNQQQQMGLQSDREALMFKRILVDTNPFMLAFSAAFIMLHSLFSFFAFKNGQRSSPRFQVSVSAACRPQLGSESMRRVFCLDTEMQFWYKNESMEGLSAGSLLFGFVCEVRRGRASLSVWP